MPRTARKRGSSHIYHIVVQGVRDTKIFESPAAKRYYLDRLFMYESKFHLDIYAYAILDSHAHLLIGEGDIDISSLMRRMNVSFAYWYKRKYDLKDQKRAGGLFAGRYLSEPLDLCDVPSVIVYIETEPWRLGMSPQQGKYPYVSHGLCYSSQARKAVQMAVSEDDAIYRQEGTHRHYLDVSALHSCSTEEEAKQILKRRIGPEPAVIFAMHKEERDNLIRALRFEDGLSVDLCMKATGLGRGIVQRVRKRI